jgi:hypothetical protein
MVAQVGYLVARRSGGWVTPCAVCTMHMKMRSVGFLVEPQNQGIHLSVIRPQNHWDGFLQFGLKTGGDSFLWFGLKTGGSSFLILASKLVATVW